MKHHQTGTGNNWKFPEFWKFDEIRNYLLVTKTSKLGVEHHVAPKMIMGRIPSTG